jgi:hypothetical protein
VVCGHCTRWCLVPIEERWEVVETCERTFRDSRTRVSTDQIGLAKLRDGLELVRVGAPLRPELAAWRYGREFTARRRRTVTLSIAAIGVGAGGVVVGSALGAGSAALAVIATGAPALQFTGILGFSLLRLLDNARAIRVPHDGKELLVNREELKQTVLVPTADAQGWGLILKHSWGRFTLTGEDAVRATTRLLTRANGAGAGRRAVSSAVSVLGTGETVTHALRDIALRTELLSDAHRGHMSRFIAEAEFASAGVGGGGALFLSQRGRSPHINPASLALMPDTDRLAFEMALHEERERRAMAGELAPLLNAWREADQVAAIADGLLVPTVVGDKLDELKAEHEKRVK